MGGQKGGQRLGYELSPLKPLNGTADRRWCPCLHSDDPEAATRWDARGCVLAVIGKAAALCAAADAARMMESELGA